MNREFSYYLTKFLSNYLPNHKNVSKNTIALYRDCFVLFIKFYTEQKKKAIDKLKFDEISKELILEFLLWIENSRKSSIQTRNQRLAAWKSFCNFVQFENPELLNICISIKSIEPKKYKKNCLNYLSLNEIELLLKQPNINNELEIRDLAIITLMYDSGARVQEIIDLHVYNLKFSNNYSIYLTGKGSKTRIVPIQKATAQILKKYISYNNLLKDDILFYNKYHQPLSQKGMTYILNKYIKRAKNENPNCFNNNISLHSLRHSKAMHLLESGVNIVYIRDFLGHASISTTEIYAKANPEIRRKEIEKSTANIIKNSKFSKSKQIELMEYLKNLL